ncbi:hypothetical protein V3481_005646 [Fusarium oxysporum f. sp. vasinfectum]
MLASDARSLRRAGLLHQLPYEIVGLRHLAVRWSMPFTRKHALKGDLGFDRQCRQVYDTDRSLENVKAAAGLSYCRLTVMPEMSQRCHFEIRPQATKPDCNTNSQCFTTSETMLSNLPACSCYKPVMHHCLIRSVAMLRRGRDTISAILHCVLPMEEILWIIS